MSMPVLILLVLAIMVGFAAGVSLASCASRLENRSVPDTAPPQEPLQQTPDVSLPALINLAIYEDLTAALFTLGRLRTLDHAKTHTKAISHLESRLDASLIFLADSIRGTSKAGRYSMFFQTLQNGRDYRAKFPGPSETREALTQALSFLDENTGHSGLA
jgi:hypothetical protein